MDHDYSKRDYLLPPGCNDLIDAIHYPGRSHGNIAESRDGLIAAFELPEDQIANIEVIAEGQQIRIIARSLPGQPMAQRLIEVPCGYNPAGARAVYVNGSLRIFIPKC